MAAYSNLLGLILMSIASVGADAGPLETRQSGPITEGEAPLKGYPMGNVVTADQIEAGRSASENASARPRALRHIGIANDDHQGVSDAVRRNDHDLVLGGEHVAFQQIDDAFAIGPRSDEDVLRRRRSDVHKHQFEPTGFDLTRVDSKSRSTPPEFLDLTEQSGESVQRRDEAEYEGDQLEIGGHGHVNIRSVDDPRSSDPISMKVVIMALFILLLVLGGTFHLLSRTGGGGDGGRVVALVLFAASFAALVALVVYVASF